jgi:hypothetical protein
MTDLAATSHGMIKNEPLLKYPQNLFKHDLCHNFLDTQSLRNEIAHCLPDLEKGSAPNSRLRIVRESQDKAR